MLISRLYSYIQHRIPGYRAVLSYKRTLFPTPNQCDPMLCLNLSTLHGNTLTSLSEVKSFLLSYKVNAVFYCAEELKSVMPGIWNEVLKAGSIALAEKYLSMRIIAGLKFDVNEVLNDLKKADMKPTKTIFRLFVLQSCAVGDVEQAALLVRSLKGFGMETNVYISSSMLYGYIKAGLINEALSFQSILSESGLWPTRIAYHGLLSAYADIGDETAVVRILDEASSLLPLNDIARQTHTFSPRFLVDTYQKIIYSKGDTSATCDKVLKWLPRMSVRQTFARDAVNILLTGGYCAAAIKVFEKFDPKEIEDEDLLVLPRYAARGGLKVESLRPFWEIVAVSDSHLQLLGDLSSSYFKKFTSEESSNLRAKVQTTSNEDNPEDAIDLNMNSSDIFKLFSRRIHNPFVSSCMLLRRHNISFPINDVKQIFWKSFMKNTLINAPGSIRELCYLFIARKDYRSLQSFCNRIISHSPKNAVIILESEVIEGLLQVHSEQNWDLLVSALMVRRISEPTVYKAVCEMENLRHLSPALKHHVEPSWAAEVFFRRMENDSHRLKIYKLHLISEFFCKHHFPDIVYAIQQSALKYGPFLPPKTLRSIIVTPYLINNDLFNHHHNLLLTSHTLTAHYPVRLSNALRQLDPIIKIPFTSSVDQVIDRTVDWLIQHIPCHLFVTPIDPLSNDIPTWLIVCQRLIQEGSVFRLPVNWTYLALKWFGKTDSLPSYLDCYKDWYTYAPNKNISAAMLVAGLIHPKSKEWAMKRLHKNPLNIYDVIVCDSLNQLSGENQSYLAEIISEFGKTNTLSIAHEIYKNGFNAPTLQYIINKLPEDESMYELAALCVAKEDWFNPMLSFVSEHYPEKQLAFCSNTLTILRTKPNCFNHLAYVAKVTKNAVNVSNLNCVNKWLLRAVDETKSASTMSDRLIVEEFFGILSGLNVLPDDVLCDLKSAMMCRSYALAVELMKSMERQTLEIVVPFLVYSVLISRNAQDINELLLIATDKHKELFEMLCEYSQPLMNISLRYSYQALRKQYDGQTLDWLSQSGLNYFCLGLQTTEQKDNETIEILQNCKKLPCEESMPDFAQSLVNEENNEAILLTVIMSISQLWDTQRKVMLLHNLVNLGAEVLVRRVLQTLSAEDGTKYAPLKYLARTIRIYSTSRGDDVYIGDIFSSYKMVRKLLLLSPDHLTSIICGPHMDTLFRFWPTEHTKYLIAIVNRISENGISSVSSHLAGVLINRGLYNEIRDLTKITEPIPTEFLAGSHLYPLTASSFHSTIKFMQTTDPDHIPEFLENCLRIAAKSTADSSELTGMIRIVTSPPYNVDLATSITPSTIQLIRCHLDKCEEVPDDILNRVDSSTQCANQ
ncbi:unnamed protein product [Heterobilharzia americana]|nr:unnamed protein product [Heterobilharzia americana]